MNRSRPDRATGRRIAGPRERGAAAVELALVLPLLALLLFGIIDFGRMLNAQVTLTEAAREGARAAAFRADPAARVRTATSGLDSVTVTATSCPTSPSATDDAVVTVRHEFRFITPVGSLTGLFGSGVGDTVTLSAKGVMPCRG